MYAYEAYLTNGFDDQIINNADGKTFLPASKTNPDRFEESFNGSPLFTGKVAVKNRKIGEVGLSYMGGIYNKYEDDGLVLDKKRQLNVFAVDFIPHCQKQILSSMANGPGCMLMCLILIPNNLAVNNRADMLILCSLL